MGRDISPNEFDATGVWARSSSTSNPSINSPKIGYCFGKLGVSLCKIKNPNDVAANSIAQNPVPNRNEPR